MMKLHDIVQSSAIRSFKEVKPELEQPQWNLEKIQIYRAREEFNVHGEGVNIAVIDLGVTRKHSEIAHCIKRGENVADQKHPHDIEDYSHHGTCVVGLIAGKHTGVAPEANIYVIKQVIKNNPPIVQNQVEALKWCLINDIDIINISSGYPGYSSKSEKAVKDCYDKNQIVVAACGNNSTGASFPASFDEYVISVAAIDDNSEHCIFSNIWPTVDVSAPGRDILLPHSRYWWTDYYSIERGTSFAAPHVTGVLALGISFLKRYKISYKAIELEQMLKDSCKDLTERENTSSADNLVEKYQRYYDKKKIFLRDREVTLATMYGNGMVQAYDFLELICKEKGIKK